MALGRPEYVSDLIVNLLNQLGIDYATTNPGATTRGMHESIITYGGNSSPEMITCCHEELAVAMAEGYYLATGKPLAALVHNIVGLQHASKAIYEAWLAGVPMLVIGGTGPVDLSHRRPWIDWIHTPQVQGQIVRDYVKWDDQPEGPRSVVESILRGLPDSNDRAQGTRLPVLRRGTAGSPPPRGFRYSRREPVCAGTPSGGKPPGNRRGRPSPYGRRMAGYPCPGDGTDPRRYGRFGFPGGAHGDSPSLRSAPPSPSPILIH